MSQIALQRMYCVRLAEAGAGQLLRDRVEIRNDVPLNPFDDRLVRLEGEVQFLAVVGHQSEAQERAADAVVFGVEKIAHRAPLDPIAALAKAVSGEGGWRVGVMERL